MFKSIKITQITTKRNLCRLYKYTHVYTHFIHVHTFLMNCNPYYRIITNENETNSFFAKS